MNKKIFRYFGFFIISLFATWILSVLISLKVGSYLYNKGNFKTALQSYKLSSKLAPFWEKTKIRISNTQETIKDKENPPQKEPKINLTFGKDVSIIKKNIIRTEEPFNDNNGYMLVALLKNNTDYGIPFVKINKIEMLSKNKVVAVKEDPSRGDFFMVSNGKFPFYFYLITDKYPDLLIDDFNLEADITPFTRNEDVVKLKTSNLKQLNIKQHQNQWTYYKYSVTIENPYNFPVNKIHRISILKDGLLPLNRLDTAERVTVIEKPKQNGEVIDLNAKEKEVRLSLKPGESRTIELKFKVEEIFRGHFNPEEVELTNYFVGVESN